VYFEFIADIVFETHTHTHPPSLKLAHIHKLGGSEMTDNFWLEIRLYNLMTRKGHWSSVSSDGSNGTIVKMNTELEFILHKKHVILHLLQNAAKKRDSLPIPLHLHRYVKWFLHAHINPVFPNTKSEKNIVVQWLRLLLFIIETQGYLSLDFGYPGMSC
jgi:hypothetical protein